MTVPAFKPQPIRAPRTEPLPPNATDCEETLLGNLFSGGDIRVVLAEGLTAQDFFIVKHGWIFAAIVDLFEQGAFEALSPDLFPDALDIDPVAVADLLDKRGQLAQITHDDEAGLMVLIHLATFRASPYPLAVRSLAQRIKRMAVRRRVLDTLSRLATAVTQELDTDETLLIERGQRDLDKIKPFDPNKTFIRGEHSDLTHAEMWRYQAARQCWHPVPWSGLSDRCPVTTDGELIVIAGPEGSGKSALLMNWAEFEAQQGVQTVYIHTEMNKEQVFNRRQVANSKTIPMAALMKPETLTDAQWTALTQTGVEMSSWLPCLDYWHAGLCDEAHLFAVMQRMIDDFGTRLFVLDYLNDIVPDRGRSDNGAEVWRNLLARLESFCNRNGARIITAAQLNNEGNAYMIGKALRHKAALFLKIKPDVLEHPFDFEYDGIPYRYLPGDHKPVVTIAIEKYRTGGRGVARLLYVGARFLWVDVPAGFDDGSEDPGAYVGRGAKD